MQVASRILEFQDGYFDILGMKTFLLLGMDKMLIESAFRGLRSWPNGRPKTLQVWKCELA